MKLGIEVEFWVVDERGRLTDADGLVDAHEHLYPEFVGPLVEVQTTPHESETALRRELQQTLETALEHAERAGKRLVPLGTPLTTAAPPATGERGEVFERIYGDGIESAKNCAGTHVHFEKESDAVTRQLNVLTALDPAIALVSSSPYYLGERGAASSRAAAYRGECGAAFERYCDLWPYADSVPEWEGRVETAYERYRDLAAERGVDPDRVEDLFDPEDTVLNPVRLREELPTVEWRAPDAALPDQLIRLAFDVRRLVARAAENQVVRVDSVAESGLDDGAIRVPEFPELASLSEAAIRRGLDSPRVVDYLERLGFDTAAYAPLTREVRGPASLDEETARDLRLEYADRLRTDVETLAAPLWGDRDGWPDGSFVYAPN